MQPNSLQNYLMCATVAGYCFMLWQTAGINKHSAQNHCLAMD